MAKTNKITKQEMVRDAFRVLGGGAHPDDVVKYVRKAFNDHVGKGYIWAVRKRFYPNAVVQATKRKIELNGTPVHPGTSMRGEELFAPPMSTEGLPENVGPLVDEWQHRKDLIEFVRKVHVLCKEYGHANVEDMVAALKDPT